MLKKLGLLIILFNVCACSNMNMGDFSMSNMFGQKPPKKDRNYYNSDEYLLEEDEDDGQEEIIREQQYTVRREPPRMQQREHFYAEEEFEDEYEYRPKKDRCSFYGLRPGTAAYRDCKRQLYQQRSEREFYDR